MAETVNELLHRCIAARRDGVDFPAVWHSILKGHPMVMGVPVQRLHSDFAVLEIRLITGQRIVLDQQGYSLS